MRNVDEQIHTSNMIICNLIDNFEPDQRGLLSQTVLENLRHFVEALSLKVAGYNDYSYENIKNQALKYVAANSKFQFLSRFHKLLQISKSHYATDQNTSERLMLKYYEYLLKIKKFMKCEYNIEILQNIEDFPLHTDPDLKEYHNKIVEKINAEYTTSDKDIKNIGYYIHKIKPFFVNQEVFYEITFRIANDKNSKFDRFIAFTKLEITKNYSVRLLIRKSYIDVFQMKMPIQIIEDWQVQIRPCEIRNIEKLFNNDSRNYNKDIEYNRLMSVLTSTRYNLVEIIDLPDEYFDNFITYISKNSNQNRLTNLIIKTRSIVREKKPGHNVLRYLFFNLNNRIIKQQYLDKPNNYLSNLNLTNRSIPFDNMPFATSLAGHNPSISNLYDCIDITEREHELFAKNIINNTEIMGSLYTHLKDLNEYEDTANLIAQFNNKLYNNLTQQERKIKRFKDYVYISGYDKDVITIITELKKYTDSGILNYKNSINTWLSHSNPDIDDCQKKAALKKMFSQSKVSIIYGAAGTGKTKLVEHISIFHNNQSKLYLANTHSAVSNMKSRITAQNATFKTINSYLYDKTSTTNFDLLIIDECSVISNIDMREILKKASFGALILLGDIYQIESIRFGNWFYLIREFVPQTSCVELTTPYRAQNSDLLDLWNKVRNLDTDIIEHITKNNYSTNLDSSIFEQTDKDEIILCLNYDGLYGINNINNFLQQRNEKSSYQWGPYIFKVNDPILFNESDRFKPVLHNNLKGKIIAIKIISSRIQFDIEIDKSINELDLNQLENLQLLKSKTKTKSVIRFHVNKFKYTDEDNDKSASDIIPFQIAYAVSIHKAQGLEYNSVKIIFTNESEERISHNIFYTSITRAREKLKIYCTPEIENNIIKKFNNKFDNKDMHLLKTIHNLK